MSLKKYFKLYTLLLLFSFCKAQNKDNFPEIKLIGPPAIENRFNFSHSDTNKFAEFQKY